MYKGQLLIYGINYEPEPIGVGKYTAELARYLSSQGYGVRVVTAPPHYPGWSMSTSIRNAYSYEILGGVEVFRSPLILNIFGRRVHRIVVPLTFAMFSFGLLFYAVLRRRPSVLICVEPTLFCVPAALLICKMLGIRSVLHVQDLEVDAAFAVGHLSKRGLTPKIAFLFERICLQGFNRVITISDRMRALIVSKGVDPKRVATVRNWVNFPPVEKAGSRADFRQQLNITKDKFVVVYSGSIGAKQDLETILKAAASLAEDPTKFFVFAGEGPEKLRLMGEFGKLKNVLFLPLIPAAEFDAFLSIADLHLVPQIKGIADLVLPSKVGSILACGGRLMVVSERDSEIVQFTKGIAIVVSPGDVDGIVEGIKYAYENKSHDSFKSVELGRQLDSAVVLPKFERNIISDN